MNRKTPVWYPLRRSAGSLLVEALFSGLSRAGRLHPASRLERHGVEMLKDIPYRHGAGAEHLLDVYRPVRRSGPLPVCLYVHGGGFRILSKETHWLMGLVFARRGYVVFNINYRLSPGHPFPAALEDTCEAFAWAVEHAGAYGGDREQTVLAGESAGANLITALTIATCCRRPEPYTKKAWSTGVVPRAVVPACGLFQVSDPGRFSRNQGVSWFVQDRLTEVSEAYLARLGDLSPEERQLADPLLVLERGLDPERPLPPFFIPVGTRDPVADDSRRLDQALKGLGVRCTARSYPGEGHAFHAFVFREQARACWRDTFEFLEGELATARPSAAKTLPG